MFIVFALGSFSFVRMEQKIQRQILEDIKSQNQSVLIEVVADDITEGVDQDEGFNPFNHLPSAK